MKLFTFVTQQDALCVVSREIDEEDKELPPFITISVADSLGDNPEQIVLTQQEMDMLCGLWMHENFPGQAPK